MNIKYYNKIITTSHTLNDYQFPIKPTISLDKLNNPSAIYIKIHLIFKIDKLDGYQNLFQTAPGNEGLRLEISDSIATLVLANKLSAGGIKGLILSTDIHVNQWYELVVAVKNGEFITASLDGKQVLDYKSPGINLNLSNVLFGEGYDHSRKFQGIIKNITFEEGEFLSDDNRLYRLATSLIGIFLIVFMSLSLIARIPLKYFGSIYMHYLALITTTSVTFFYNIIFFDKYFPITEGWFSTYSSIIRNGKIPYKDFYLFLTPLYPLQISIFQEIFGDSFYYLRILGLLISTITAVFLYLILSKLFKPYIASVCAITAMIYYESGVAFINYDFTQFLTLYCLCSIYFLLLTQEYFELIYSHLFAFLTGFFASFAFLIKQSNGGIFLIFTLIAFLYVIFINKKYRLIYPIVTGVFVPLISLLYYLHKNSALPLFFEQVFTGAIQSKGGALAGILIGWIQRLELSSLLYSFHLNRRVLIILLVIIIINIIVLKFKAIEYRRSNIYDNIYLIFFSLFSLLVIHMNHTRDGLYKVLFFHKISNASANELHAIVLSGFGIFFCYLSILRLCKVLTNAENNLVLLLILSIGLIIGNGTSAGISEISLFIPFALITGTLMSILDPTRLLNLFIGWICLMIIFNFSNRKFEEPYAWWYTSEPGIYESHYKAEIPTLHKIMLSKNSATTLNGIYHAIESHSVHTDDVFYFPNISGLYAVTNRLPHSKSVVTWFDFFPDNLARDEANRIIENPPKIIVNLNLPPNVWDAHEKYFRDGNRMGQRDIQEAIQNLTTKSNSQYTLIYKEQINPYSQIEVWSRI